MDKRFNIITKLDDAIEASTTIDKERKALYISKLDALDFELIKSYHKSAIKSLTTMDIKYLTCFLIDMPCTDIALLFNIEPSSVHMARYRLKQKFDTVDTWLF